MKYILSLIFPILLSACSAYKIIPDEVDSKQSNSILLTGPVKIKTDKPEGKVEELLAKALMKQKLSTVVLASTSKEDATYEVELESVYTGRCFAEPLLTVLSLGLIPYVGCAELGYKVTLLGKDKTELVSVDASKKVKTVYGVAAWLLLLSPSWVGEGGVKEYEAKAIVHELSAYSENID
ncbi:hypothetical protein KCM76_23260 [Zooshikella marina]|uniref:hypothetical protein n=1 Tax=Zooshikella ganghwensis TaxID=202772 RepID=UPI001BAF300E|nr:hypothetical protein [Zooshikella ganghwensis]MBU2708933.1 hypothetical protein [Zooshikella ganghwensis]